MTPYVYCEPFCGMASLTYWLLGAAPPISYMGSKRFYSDAIAAILGLSRHHRPAAIVLGDVGPTVAVHAGLFGAAGVTARDVAGWLWVGGHENPYGNDLKSQYAKPEGNADGSWKAPPRDWLANRSATLPHPRAAEVAAIIRGWKDEEPRALWTRLKAEGWPSLLPVDGGRWLGPQDVEEVARFVHVMSLCVAKDGRMSGYSHVNGEGHDFVSRDGKQQHWTATTPDGNARRMLALPSSIPPLACWQGTAARLVEQLPERLDSWITYLDPPYSGTTGYPFGDCPREEVLRIALDLHRRGATVAISEAVRLDGELGEEWHAVRIDSERKGQKRTFSVQQSEWLTLNRPPVTRPGVQVGLWGAP